MEAKGSNGHLHLRFLALTAILLLGSWPAFATASVTVTPSTINLPALGSQQFTATVTGASDTTVTWTLLEGPAGGVLSSSGLYTAPSQPGTYHVVATSNADRSQSATAVAIVPGFIIWGLTTPRVGQTATLLPDGRVLFAGGMATNSQATDSAELYNSAIDQSTSMATMTAARTGHTAVLLPNGQVLIAGGQGPGGTLASAELFNPLSGTFAATGNMTVARSGHTTTLLSNGKALITGGVNCSSACTNPAELYDPATGMFTSSGTMAHADQYQSATLLNSGKVLFAAGVVNGTATSDAELYDPVTGLFTATGQMTTARQSTSATLLLNGKVLFAGGLTNVLAVTPAAELYDPTTGTFGPTGSLNIARDLPTATLLSSGNVLIAGGNSTLSKPSISEIYVPSSGTFQETGALADPRINHTATLLSNGTVLIAAGIDDQILGNTEFYNPSSGSFNHHGAFLNVARTKHTATMLGSGQILFAGGENLQGTTATAEIYNPTTMTMVLTGSMTTPREAHTATQLADGRVLIVGGTNDASGSGTVPLATAEMYDPTAGTFSGIVGPSIARLYHTATLLNNGKVLVTGGLVPGFPLPPNNLAYSSAELYDPSTGAFSATGSMSVPRFGHTATLLNDGRVLIAGGVDPTQTFPPPPPVELYDPNAGTFSPIDGNINSLTRYPDIPFASALLVSGQVLAAVDVTFNPSSGTFSSVDTSNLSSFVSSNGGYSFDLLPNGQVFVTGLLGTGGNETAQLAAYLFDPNGMTYSPAGIARHSRSTPTVILLPENEVLIAGGNNSTTPSDVYEVEFYQAPGPGTLPSVTSVSPVSFTGFAPLPFTVNGTNFVSGASIQLDGAPLQTTFLSITQLSATVPAQTLLVPGNHSLTVTNFNGVTTASFTVPVINPLLQTLDTSGSILSFGNVAQGATSTSQSLSFENAGNAPLNLVSIAISGANSGDFAFDPANTTCPLAAGSISAMNTCSVSIKFAPQAIRSSTATFTIAYETPGSPFVLTLNGTGVGTATVSVIPTSLAFGNQAAGSASAPQSVTISNSGAGSLAINSVISSDPSDFPPADNCAASLAPGSSCGVAFSFTPSASGNILATFTINSSDPGSPHTIQLSGTGVVQSAVSIAPSSLAFGSQFVGNSGAPQTVSISNTGAGSLSISGISLTNSTDFSMTRNCPSSLSVGIVCTFTVTFTPSTAGILNGSIVFTTGNSGSSYAIPLTGTGINFSISPISTSASTMTIAAGQTANYQLSLSPQVFSGAVALSCVESPTIPNATCAISPNPANLNGTTAATIVVAVTTAARGTTAARFNPMFPINRIRDLPDQMWICCFVMLAGTFAISRIRRITHRILLPATLILLVFLAGCGSTGSSSVITPTVNSGGTPAGTYQLLIS